MANYLQFIKRTVRNPIHAIKQQIEDSKDIERFRPTGTQVYVGKQGSGKTISAVHHVLTIWEKYPKSILVTNLQLNTERDYIHFKDIDELSNALTQVNNGKYGVLYLIDEIHTYFNALESKNIPPYIFTEISQQRKQRKCIVGTSQLFPRIAKPFREQVDNVIVCRTWLGFITTQKAYDGETLEQDYSGKYTGDIKKRSFFIQTPKLRSIFDTYQKINSGMIEYNTQNNQKIELTIKKGNLLKR